MKRETTTDERNVFKFLNKLRDSGDTNMFGATPYINKRFPYISQEEARHILSTWMKVFNADGNYDEIEINEPKKN